MIVSEDTVEVGLILSGVTIFQDLSFETVKAISRHTETVRFETGQKLIKKGTKGEQLFIIIKGKVEIRYPIKSENTYKSVYLNKGSVIGEISLLTDKPYCSDTIALSNTTCLSLERTAFNDLIDRFADFAETMTNLLSERLVQKDGLKKVRRYQLLNKMGEGNMAIVYNARDPELERNVAIKMLKFELSHDKEFLSRFEREAKLIASLNHPNIINVFEIIQDFSTRFMVMEKLKGKDLAHILKQKGTLSLIETRDILYQVASALRYAHNHGVRGIVHRDIKPSNIFIDDQGHVKLTDFGISSPPFQEDDVIAGSPFYLAPEVINKKTVDGRADIYALGVMAFHMLTGKPPFTATTLTKLFYKQCNQQPPSIKEQRPDIDSDMVKFIDGALEKDPNQRISDWNLIRVLLKPGAARDLNSGPVQVKNDDEFVFEVRLKKTSYQKAAKVINGLKKSLEENIIDHSIKMKK